MAGLFNKGLGQKAWARLGRGNVCVKITFLLIIDFFLKVGL